VQFLYASLRGHKKETSPVFKCRNEIRNKSISINIIVIIIVLKYFKYFIVIICGKNIAKSFKFRSSEMYLKCRRGHPTKPQIKIGYGHLQHENLPGILGAWSVSIPAVECCPSLELRLKEHV
jgi:hypothetical protein